MKISINSKIVPGCVFGFYYEKLFKTIIIHFGCGIFIIQFRKD
jgi:hypothetical protein